MTATIGICNNIDGLPFGFTTVVILVIIGFFDRFAMFKEMCYIVKDRRYGLG